MTLTMTLILTAAIGDERYRRVELITGTTRQLRRGDEERARIVAESFEPGANIAAVARKHGVNGGLLHHWRKRAKAQAGETTAHAGAAVYPGDDRGGEQGRRWRGHHLRERAWIGGARTND